MRSHVHHNLRPWKHVPPSLTVHPARTKVPKTLAPVLFPFQSRKRRLEIASTLRVLAPGALGERIEGQLVLLDIVAMGAAALISQRISDLQQLPSEGFATMTLLQLVLTLLFASFDGVYSPRISRSLQKQLLVLCKASLFSWFAVALVTKSPLHISCWHGLLSLWALIVFRIARQHYLETATCNRKRRNILIVGGGPRERELADAFHNADSQLRRVVGFLDDKQPGCNVLGGIADLARVARAEFVDEVIVGNIANNRLPWVIEEAARNQLNITVVPELFGYSPTLDAFEYAGGCALLKLRQAESPYLGQLWKRALDLIVSVIGLVAFAPVFAAIALAIKLDSKGPALYRSTRAGRKGGEFICFKFRTMVTDADSLKEALRAKNERSGPFFKIAADPRITRVGRWLRRYSLDELPQLWNVLRGEMSLVGPRPHPLDDYQQYRLEHLKRLDVTPGLTGLWQVTARSSPSFQHSVALDLDYIQRWSFWLDFKILLKTLRVVFSGSGA